jgi:hypothetical protein
MATAQNPIAILMMGNPSEDEEVLSELFQFSGGDHCMTVVRVKSSELDDQLEHYKMEQDGL